MRVCFSAVSGRAGFQSGNLMGHFPILGPAKLTERDDMISLQKHGWLVVVLAGAALAACVQGEQQSQSADSTARNLTLAPTESTAALKDVPPPATEAAKPAPEKKAPVKKPVAAKPAQPVSSRALSSPALASRPRSPGAARPSGRPLIQSARASGCEPWSRPTGSAAHLVRRRRAPRPPAPRQAIRAFVD